MHALIEKHELTNVDKENNSKAFHLYSMVGCNIMGPDCVNALVIYRNVSRPKPYKYFLVINEQELDCSTHERNSHWPSDNLNWSFIKNHQPRFEVYMQIALAINEEMKYLEAGGI